MKNCTNKNIFILAGALCLLMASSSLAVDTNLHNPADTRLGINFTHLADYSPEFSFVNILHNGRNWTSIGNGWNDGRPLDMDENGYIRSLLPAGHDDNPTNKAQSAVTLIGTSGSRYPAGDYLFLFEGQAATTNIYFTQGATNVIVLAPGRWVVQADPGPTAKAMYLEIRTIPNTNNYPRNLQLIMPGYHNYTNAIDTNQVFTTHFLNRWQEFDAIRFMNWMKINDSPVSNWTQRTPPGALFYTGEAGAPYEILIDLCNTVGAHPWFNIPHLATDEFVTNFAALVRDRLDTNLFPYIEYSNETWNGIFGQHTYVDEMGLLMWPELSNQVWQAGQNWYGMRAMQIHSIFTNVYGGHERIVRLVQGQAGGPGISEGMFAANPGMASSLDAYAVAPYISLNVSSSSSGTTPTLDQFAEMDVDDILDWILTISLPDSIFPDRMENNYAFAQSNNLPLITYEGGQSVTLKATTDYSNQNGWKVTEANQSPRMVDVYMRYLRHWNDMGGGLFNAYSSSTAYVTNGAWVMAFGAFWEDMQPNDESPKYNALLYSGLLNATNRHLVVSTNWVTVPEGSSASFQLKLSSAPAADTTVTVLRAFGDTNIAPQTVSVVIMTNDWDEWKTIVLQAEEDPDYQRIADEETVIPRCNGTSIIRCRAEGMLDAGIVAYEADNDFDPEYTIPWSETFENDGTHAGDPGPLDGQNKWKATTTGAVVQSSTVYKGSQAASLNYTRIERTSMGVATSAWIHLYMKPSCGDTNPGPVSASAVFWPSTSGQIMAFSNNVVVALPVYVSPDEWSEFLVHMDYSSQTWSLKVNGANAASSLGFYQSANNFDTFGISQGRTGDAYVDDISIAADSDGLPAGIELSTGALDIPENDMASFGIRLSSVPAGDITARVSFVSGDTSISVQTPDTFIFNSGNWSNWRSVVLSAAPDGDTDNGTAVIRCESDGAVSAQLTAIEQDDDELMAIVVSTNLLTVLENSSITFNVHLTTDPLGSVTVEVSRISGDTNLNVTGGAQLIFNSDNYSTNQTVTLTVVPDDDALHGSALIQCLASTLSCTSTVTAIIHDDDISIIPSVSSLSVPENGTNSFDVILNAKPFDTVNVSIGYYSGDTHISILPGGASLIFTTNDWDIAQPVSLTAADDGNSANEDTVFLCSASGVGGAYVTATAIDDDVAAPTLFAYEPFAYDPGVIGGNNGGTGWSSAWSSDTNFIVISPAAELVYSNASGVLIPGGDRALLVSGNNSPVLSRALPNLRQNFYYSFLISMTAGTIDYDDHMLIGDLNGASESGVSFGRFGSGTADNLAGAIADNVASEILAQTLTQNQVYMMVCKFSWDATDQRYEQVDVWINPTNRTAEEAQYHLTATDSGGFCAGGYNELDIAQQVLDAGDTFVIDEIRMGANWSDVVAPQLASIEVSTSSVLIPEGGTNTFDVRLTANPGDSVTVTVTRATGGDDDITVDDADDTLVFDTSNWSDWRTVKLIAANDGDTINGTATIECSANGMATEAVSAQEVDKGSLLMSENFDYTLGEIAGADGGHGWSGAWSSNSYFTVVVPATALSYQNTGAGIYVDGGSNALQIDGAGGNASITRSIASQTGDLYYSFLARRTSGANNYDEHVLVGDAASSSESGALFGRFGSGTTDDLGGAVVKEQALEFVGAPLSLNADYLFVAKLTWDSGSSSYRRVDVWVNPTNLLQEQAQYSTFKTNATGFGTGGLTAWTIYQSALDVGDDTFLVGALAVGTNWYDVLTGGFGAQPAIMTDVSSLNVPENGSNTFQVCLTTAPSVDTTVTVSRVSGGDSNIIVSAGASLVFTPSSWDWKTVTLFAEDDPDSDNGSALIQCAASGLTTKYVTATEADDDSSGGSSPAEFTLLFDYGQSGANETTNTGWNNITSLTTASPLAVVVDSTGATTEVTYAQSSPASTSQDNYSGIVITDLSYPESAWRDSLNVGSGQSFTITLGNLDTNQLFNITILGSRSSTAADYTTYIIGGVTNRIFVEYNDTDRTGVEDISAGATDLATFNSIAPSAAGEIVITVDDATTYKYISLIEVSTVSSGGGGSGPQIQASSTSVSVPEGGTNTFQLRLTAQPESNTTVSLSISGDSDITISGDSSLLFTTSDWDSWQTVTLNAASDEDLISGTAYVLCQATGLSNLTVTATEADTTVATTNRILLIGNSYSMINDPGPNFQRLIEAAGRSADVDLSVEGGVDLKWHWEDGAATNAIATGNYDYVILQEYSEAAFTARLTNSFQPYAPLFHECITNQNAKTLFYAHWAKEPYIMHEGIPEAQTNVNAMYFNMADQLGDQAEASPVGIGFKRALEQNHLLLEALEDELSGIYNTNGMYRGNGDTSHVSLRGVYLTSCTFYSTIYQQSPEGIPLYYIYSSAGSTLSMSTNEARFFQRLAWDAYTYHHATNPPQLTLNASTNAGGLGTVVSFTANASDDSAITDYTWNFGDGTVTNGVALTNVSHTYTETGFFDAWVRVTDSSNETERVGEVIIIDNSPPALNGASSSDSNAVVLAFSKTLDPTTAETTGNYTLSGGLNVNAASLSGNLVTLTPSVPFETGTSYTVTVSNVEDLYGNPVASGSTAVFQYVPDTTTYYTVLFDLGDGNYPTAGNWNNVTNADTGLWIQNAVDTNGNATTIGLRITDAFLGSLDEGLVTNLLYPDTARRDALYVLGGHLAGPGDDTQAVIRVEGLDTANTYDISFFASQTSQYHNTHFTIGAVDVNLEASGNLDNEVRIQDVSPDSSGNIDITVWGDQYCDRGVLGVLKIVYPDNSGAAEAALADLREGCRLEVTYRNILKNDFDSTKMASLNNFRAWTNSSGSYTAASYTNILNLWLNNQPLTAVQSNHLPIVKAAYMRQAWDVAGAQQRSVSNEAWDVYATSVLTNGEALMTKGFSGATLSDAEIDALRDYCIYIQMQSTGAERLPYQLSLTRAEDTPFETGEDAPQFMLRKAETVFGTQAFNDAALQDMTMFLKPEGVTEVLNLFAGYTNVSGVCTAKPFPASVANETDYVRRQTNSARPVVLMMGKSSDVMLRRNIPIMDAFYQAYKDVADIYIVHTSYHDSFSSAPYYYGPYAGGGDERIPWQWTEEDFAQDVRRSMIRYPSLSIPFLIDDSTHRNRNSFFNGGGSAHFVIIDCEGKIAYAAPQVQAEGWTPFDAILQVNDVEYELRRVLANNGLAEAGRDRDIPNVLRQAMIDNGALTAYRPAGGDVPLWLTGQITGIDTNSNTITVMRPAVNTNSMWGYNIIQENDPVVDLGVGTSEAQTNLTLLNRWINDGQKVYTLAIGAGSTNFSFSTTVNTNVTEVYLNGLPVEIGSLQVGDSISAMYNDTADETNTVIKPLYFRASRTGQEIVVSTNALNVTEGTTNSFTVQLSSAPAADVTVTVEISGDEDLTLASPATLLFTTTGWDTPQTVYVAAAVDSDEENGTALIRCTANGPLGANVNVAEQDTGAHFVNRPMLFDFGVSSVTTPGNWNNVTDKSTGTKITSAVSTNGYSTGIALTITDAFNYELTGGVDTNVLYPSTAQRDYFRVNSADTTGAFQLSGLNSNTLYTFTFFGSMATTPADTRFTINGTYVVLDTYLNVSNTVTIADVLPDASGNITVTVARNSTGSGALGVMEVTTTEYTGGPAVSIVTDVSSLNVTEGSTNVFQVKLSAQPANDTTVIVSRTAGDTNILVNSGAKLVFTATDWDWKTVELYAENDPDTSSDSATITCASDGMTPVNVTATEVDTDTLQIQLSTTSVTVPEGSTNTFQVKLTAQPVNDTTVTVSRTAGDTNILVNSGAELVFTAADWDWKTVELYAENDPDTSSDSATITCASAGLTPQYVTAYEADNTSTGGGSSGALFSGLLAAWNFQDVTTVVTTTPATVLSPTGMVSASLTHSDPTQLRAVANAVAALGTYNATLADAITAGKYFTWTMNVEPGYQLVVTNITITTESYSPVTGAVFSSVSGFTDGDQLVLISSGTQTASTDVNLSGITNQVEFRLYGYAADASTDRLVIGDSYSSSATQHDVRVYGYISEIVNVEMLVSTDTVQVAEGSTNTFQIKLSAQPITDTTVTVSCTSGDTSITVDGDTELVFSSANWSNWQTVVLSASEDDDADAGSATITCSSGGMLSTNVTAYEVENDSLQIQLSTNALSVAEGSTNTFQIKLTAQPLTDTTVNVSRVSGDTNLFVSSGAALVFSSTNWSDWTTVTLSADQDDDVWDSSAVFDCVSVGMATNSLTATEVDDDEPLGGPLGTYLFTGTVLTGDARTPHTESNAVAHITFSSFSRTNVLSEPDSDSDNVFCSDAWTDGTVIDTNEYISFTLNVDNDYEVTVTNITFDWSALNFRSPNNFRVGLFRAGISMGYLDWDTSSVSSGTKTYGVPAFTATSSETIEVRFYAWNTSAYDTNDIYSVDNVTLQGYVLYTAGRSVSLKSSAVLSVENVSLASDAETVSVTKALVAGDNLIGVNVEADSLSALLGDQLLPGDAVTVYDAAAQEYLTVTDLSVVTVPAGGAFWLETATARDLTLTGQARTSKNVLIVEGLQVLASPLARSADLQNMGLNGTRNANPALCDKVSTLLNGVYQIYGLDTDGVWYKADDKKVWSRKIKAAETIEIGEGFWYDAQKPFIWTAE